MRRRGRLPEEELREARSGLKPFQQRTAEAVVARMFDPDSPQRRFLVADEVGLGKTKIARAVVAETIERLWRAKTVDRIDVVYICSNHQIARQNVEDLQVVGGSVRHTADRITMLPAALDELATAQVNLVAFTPDTSLRFGTARGRVGERAMLFHLLSQPDAFGPQVMARKGATRLLSLDTKSFSDSLAEARTHPIPPKVAAEFRRVLDREGLTDDFWHYSDGRATFPTSELEQFVGRLRRALAEACIELLTPDLIILDEFQRFTSILDGQGEDGELANLLFSHPSARVLLLSATPYKMLSSADDDESHYEGFARTVRFLLGDGGEAELGELRATLAELRRGVLGHRDVDRLEATRDRIQEVLRSVMVRTERLAATPNRDGMLRDALSGSCPVTRGDVQSFLGTDRVAEAIGDVPAMVEYWKSAPYLFNFMDEYKVKGLIRDRLDTDAGQLRASLNGPHMLDGNQLELYRKVDPRNGRLRWLIDDLASHLAFDLMWIPPTMPETQLGGAYGRAAGFTKRLIFSGWTVVPKAVAAMTSFELERRHHGSRQTYSTRRNSTRLAMTVDNERYTTLALLLPCWRLAEWGDPVAAARELGATLPLSTTDLRKHVAAKIQRRLAPYLDAAVTDGSASNRWYALAQYLLDEELDDVKADDWVGEDRDSAGLVEHLRRLDAMGSEWGRPPDDLVDVLAELAIGGPAVTLLRALTRVQARFGWPLTTLELRKAAARLSWAFRSQVNTPEAVHLISRPREDYWHALLRHCIDGGLGSVLDEWLHLLPEQLRLGPTSEEPLRKLVEAASRVLKLEDGRVSVDVYGPTAEADERHLMRTHFAMRFGQARGATAEGENPVDVRRAFNSPFKPFVLVSTSVGQEGLDFHHYAHAIVHWNLPGNPVDLEQREGRVHRYKGHAVRKNIADDFGSDPELLSNPDIWTTSFELAGEREGGLNPWWVYPGETAIERLVPTLPMSRESGRLKELIEATSLYRMTMGQPRQAELLEVLADLGPEEQAAIQRAVTIDLSP